MAITSPPAPGASPDPTDIQGNLVGFNKSHQRLVFINFPNTATGKAFLAAITADVATVDAVLAFNAAFKTVAQRGGSITNVESTWLNLVLTAAGLNVLGAPAMDQMPVEFTGGMPAEAAALGDIGPSDPSTWIAPFNPGAIPVHAMAILAADNASDVDDGLLAAYATLQARIAATGVTEITPPQDGNTRSGAEVGHEHFGFKDGISQPGIVGITETSSGTDTIATGAFLIGYPDQDGNISGQGTPGQPILEGAPGYPGTTGGTPTLPPWTQNGSFVCYRRLRQDVGGFLASTQQQASAIGMPQPEFAAKLVGRWQDGAPMEVVPADDPSNADPTAGTPTVLDPDQINDFDYSDDPNGQRVAHAAHIRRVNPRNGNSSGLAESNRHRMLRRGIPFGPEFQPGEAPYTQGPIDSDRDRGLLFICYQASLADGFLFVQQSWADNPDFGQAGSGLDPVIGQNGGQRPFTMQPQGPHLMFDQWVSNTGGEFFFSPSIRALIQLAQP